MLRTVPRGSVIGISSIQHYLVASRDGPAAGDEINLALLLYHVHCRCMFNRFDSLALLFLADGLLTMHATCSLGTCYNNDVAVVPISLSYHGRSNQPHSANSIDDILHGVNNLVTEDENRRENLLGIKVVQKTFDSYIKLIKLF